MIRILNLTLLAIFAFGGLDLGPDINPRGLESVYSLQDFAVPFLSCLLLAPIAVYWRGWSSDIKLKRPGLSKWSLNPWEPLRFIYLMGMLLAVTGLAASMNVIFVDGPEAALFLTLGYVCCGLGLLLGVLFCMYFLKPYIDFECA